MKREIVTIVVVVLILIAEIIYVNTTKVTKTYHNEPSVIRSTTPPPAPHSNYSPRGELNDKG